jgi:hypothetical protein
MGQQPSPRADALRQMREEKYEAEQKRQAAERKAAPKPAAIARAAGAGIIAGNVPGKRIAKKTMPKARR